MSTRLRMTLAGLGLGLGLAVLVGLGMAVPTPAVPLAPRTAQTRVVPPAPAAERRATGLDTESAETAQDFIAQVMEVGELCGYSWWTRCSGTTCGVVWDSSASSVVWRNIVRPRQTLERLTRWATGRPIEDACSRAAGALQSQGHIVAHDARGSLLCVVKEHSAGEPDLERMSHPLCDALYARIAGSP